MTAEEALKRIYNVAGACDETTLFGEAVAAIESALREKDERIAALERQVAHFKELADEQPPRGMSWEDATS